MPGAKFTLRGLAVDSIVSPGCIVSGGSIDDSVLSPNVRVYENAKVSDSVILSDVTIGKGPLSDERSSTRTWWSRTRRG